MARMAYVVDLGCDANGNCKPGDQHIGDGLVVLHADGSTIEIKFQGEGTPFYPPDDPIVIDKDKYAVYKVNVPVNPKNPKKYHYKQQCDGKGCKRGEDPSMIVP